MEKAILITGASSGIGRALSLELAGRSYRIALAARRTEVLEEIQAEIQRAHPACKTTALALDVTNYASVPETVRQAVDTLGGIDIVFVNAGVGLSGKVGRDQFAKDKRTIETNLLGAIATVDAAVAHFLEQGGGQIVGVSSVAALRGMPGNAAYCASKAGLAIYLEALRAEVYRKNIHVSVLYPGYIDTPLNDMLKSRPFLISAEKGAAIIARLIEKKVKSSAVPPMPWSILGPALKLLPTRLIAKMG